VNRLSRWLFTPVPLARFAVFRTLVGLFVLLDVMRWSEQVRSKVYVPVEFYEPLRIARVLSFVPEPTSAVITATFWVLVLAAPLVVIGWRTRVTGVVLFLAYGQWMLVAMSYGKVDHDRLGILVALGLLATVGEARYGDTTPSEAAGWVFRMVQLGVVATYFLAAWAKIRFGGIEWLWGGTLAWAISRRGTWFSNWMLQVPVLLKVGQVLMVALEAMAPVIFFVSERTRYLIVAGLYVFHMGTVLALGIGFWPHLVALTAFLPLERVRPITWWRERVGPSARPAPLGLG
jgi:hypothetical protein